MAKRTPKGCVRRVYKDGETLFCPASWSKKDETKGEEMSEFQEMVRGAAMEVLGVSKYAQGLDMIRPLQRSPTIVSRSTVRINNPNFVKVELDTGEESGFGAYPPDGWVGKPDYSPHPVAYVEISGGKKIASKTSNRGFDRPARVTIVRGPGGGGGMMVAKTVRFTNVNRVLVSGGVAPGSEYLRGESVTGLDDILGAPLDALSCYAKHPIPAGPLGLGAAGWFLGGPIGAAIGAGLGYWLAKR